VTTRRSTTAVSRKQSAYSVLPEAGVVQRTVPYRVDPLQPEPTPPGRLPGTGGALPNLGNDPIEDSKPARVLSNRELRELRKKEKKNKELREKLEVRRGPHSQRHVSLIPLQKEEKEARELQEKLEVCCDFFQENGVLTVIGGEAPEGART